VWRHSLGRTVADVEQVIARTRPLLFAAA